MKVAKIIQDNPRRLYSGGNPYLHVGLNLRRKKREMLCLLGIFK